jgi:Bifunctional DNA primase/polymerase, N-terminal/AAA domain/Primase C terminal 1 (PriCT-1)
MNAHPFQSRDVDHNRVTAQMVSATQTVTSMSADSDALALENAKDWIHSENSPDAEGDARHAIALEVANKMHKFGIARKDALELIAYWNVFACTPELDRSALEEAVETAYSNAQHLAGLRRGEMAAAGRGDHASTPPEVIGPLSRRRKPTTKLEWALDAARRGFRVFPVIPNGKIPAITNWQNLATTDEKQIRAWWAIDPEYNIGTGTGDLVVFDADKAKGGLVSFAEMRLYDEFPATLTSKTQGGGLHLIYDRPPHTRVAGSVGKLAPGIDIRADGNLIVLPGSSIEGREYTWFDESPRVNAPAWLVERCKARRPRSESAGKILAEETEASLAKAEAWLEKHAPIGEEGNRDNTAYKVAVRLYEIGVRESSCELLLTEWNFDRCFPPLDLSAIERIAHSAARSMQNPRGIRSPDYAGGFEPIEIDESRAPVIATKTEPVRPEDITGPVPFQELFARVVKPVEEIIPGLIEKGTVTFLSAPGGLHKSRLALQWGLCIDNGTPVFGRPVERATFVYVSCEDPDAEVTRRTQAIGSRLQLPQTGPGHYWDLFGKDYPLAIVEESGACLVQPFWHRLRDYLLSIEGHKFVVFDGTYNMLRFVGQAKLNETSVIAGIGVLQRLCNETDATALSLWHPSQAGQDRGDASGWSVAWHNGPRARLSLTAVKDCEDAWELKTEKRNHGAKGKPLILHWSNGVLLPRSETTTVEQENQFQHAVIRVAMQAAELGVPIKMQPRLAKWHLDEIESEIGRRPAEREVKDTLAAAVPRGVLCYLSGTRHRTAGYYPVDRAEELAQNAKRHRSEASDGTARVQNRVQNQGKTRCETRYKTK